MESLLLANKPKEAIETSPEKKIPGGDDLLNKEGPKKIFKKKKSLIQRLNEIGTVAPREIVEFTRHLSVMMGAGVTIFEAINFLKAQSKNKVFQSRLDSILESLNNGQALSSALRKFPKIFPEIYVNIIHVGEQAGSLPETLNDLADHLEESDKFKSKVKGALIYPKIILTVMLTFILVLVLFVLPRILTVFKSLGAQIPLPTRIMIGTTEFINSHILMLICIVLGLVAAGYIALKNPTVRRWRDIFYLKVPLVGHIVVNYYTAEVSQHFGTLFASGITIVQCLEITGSVINNIIYREEIAYMVNRIKSGVSLSQSFPEKSYFPPMFTKLINVGERTGKLPHVIAYMKGYYKGLVDNDVKNITTIIEPLIMVALGLLVAGLVITVIGPIYQLISNISGAK
jgi:type IV pilus assembly protein PilC